jgi:deoxyribodipyrimidine photo-lyase
MHPSYESLRPAEPDPILYQALTEGGTGWPLVDACIAMLKETGWLNFRMRAMLVSVATYPMWLHWRLVGLWLAKLFLDYEPGIHWPQIQMQSGTTGINTIRIYNPIKQAMQHDPKGEFVRRWLPYMQRVPDLWLFEPWRMPSEVQRRYGVRVGEDIPMPIVDLDKALIEAKERIFALRKEPEAQRLAEAVIRKHGSRPGMPSGRDAEGREPTFPRRRLPPPAQPSLF